MGTELHVIFGAGQIGTPLAQCLLKAGKRVRVIRRSKVAVPIGAELMTGEASDQAFCNRVTLGASSIYHCMNPPYVTSAWDQQLPLLMANMIAAASGSNARLVVLDNLYMLGRTHGQPMDEATLMNPCSKKGDIRAHVATMLLMAIKQGNVKAVTGRASDFYGPGGRLTNFGEFFWKPALSNKAAWTLIDPDAVHTYHYIPDVASSLALLGMAESDVDGKIWMLPCKQAETMRKITNQISLEIGHEIKIHKLPKLMVKGIGAFMPIAKEVYEMLYQWDEPFVVNDSQFRNRFGSTVVDRNQAIKDSVEWAKIAYKN